MSGQEGAGKVNGAMEQLNLSNGNGVEKEKGGIQLSEEAASVKQLITRNLQEVLGDERLDAHLNENKTLKVRF